MDFCIRAIDDEVDTLKEYNRQKKFVPFTEEMIKKVSQDQEFYTATIQPYMIIQLKKQRDHFVQTQAEQPERLSDEDSSDQKNQADSDSPNEEPV